MVKNFLEFQSDVESDAGRTCLVLTKEGLTAKQLLEFQIAMIAQNHIPGIIKVEVKELDSHVKLYYHLSGLISLTNYLRRQRISKAEFTEILDEVISVLLRSGNYLLNDNSFVLKEDFIYIDPKSKQIRMVYLPIETEGAAAEDFKSFLVNLLINTATIDTKDNYVQLLLNQVKSEQFSLVEFRQQLSVITGDAVRDAAGDAHSQAQEGLKQIALPWHQTACCNTELTEQTITATAEPNHGPVNKKREDKHNFNQLPAGETTKPKMRRIVLTVLAVLSVILAVFSTMPLEARALLPRPDKATYIVFGLSLSGLLAVIAVLSLAKKNKSPLLAGKITSSEMPEQLENSSFTERNLYPVTSDRVASVDVTYSTGQTYDDETAFLDNTSAETSLLFDSHYPQLKSVSGEEVIVINKNEFRVGRQKEITDYVISSKNIGRVHAQINCCDNDYYITDMDSTNGTFINGSRIFSNKQYLLKPNDKVMFANLEYVFIRS